MWFKYHLIHIIFETRGLKLFDVEICGLNIILIHIIFETRGLKLYDVEICGLNII